jgi:hypothetical protein
MCICAELQYVWVQDISTPIMALTLGMVFALGSEVQSMDMCRFTAALASAFQMHLI